MPKTNTKKEKINIEEIKNKDIFDLTKSEFKKFFEECIRSKIKNLIKKSKFLDILFLSNDDGSIFRALCMEWFVLTLLFSNGAMLPAFMESKIVYFSAKFGYYWLFFVVVASFFITYVPFIVVWLLLLKLIFDKPAKKIIFKELGFEYYNGLFHNSNFEYIAKYFSKILFRVDEMIEGKYKDNSLAVLDCVEKGYSHKIFIATKIERKFSAQTLIKTKGSLDSPFFKGSAVNLEDIKFSKVYNVFADDQVEARYILTPTFMERLLKYNHKQAGNTQVFFSDKISSDYNVFFYIPVNKNWFEFEIALTFSKYIKSAWFYSFLQDIKEIMSVVEALKLDQDIGM